MTKLTRTRDKLEVESIWQKTCVEEAEEGAWKRHSLRGEASTEICWIAVVVVVLTAIWEHYKFLLLFN